MHISWIQYTVSVLVLTDSKSVKLYTGSVLGGVGPNAVLCKTCSVLLCVLEHLRGDNSSAGPYLEAIGPIGLRLVLAIHVMIYIFISNNFYILFWSCSDSVWGFFHFILFQSSKGFRLSPVIVWQGILQQSSKINVIVLITMTHVVYVCTFTSLNFNVLYNSSPKVEYNTYSSLCVGQLN